MCQNSTTAALGFSLWAVFECRQPRVSQIKQLKHTAQCRLAGTEKGCRNHPAGAMLQIELLMQHIDVTSYCNLVFVITLFRVVTCTNVHVRVWVGNKLPWHRNMTDAQAFRKGRDFHFSFTCHENITNLITVRSIQTCFS